MKKTGTTTAGTGRAADDAPARSAGSTTSAR